MPFLKALLKLTGGPGSIPFLFWGLALGLALRRFGGKAGRLFGSAWLVSLAVLYLALSLPIVANRLADSLTTYHPLTDPSQLAPIDTIVVFDGDNRRGRVREAMRLYEAVHPARVIVSGANWIVDALIGAGIPANVVVHDGVPRTTMAQLERLREMDGQRTVVVASRLQMPRIARFAEAMRLSVKLAPAPLDAEPAFSGPRTLIPSYLALRKGRDTLYEQAAGIYYRGCVGSEGGC